MRRAALGVLALALTGVAVVLVLLALDVRAWQSSFRSSDLAFRAEPQYRRLWRPDQIVPFGTARRLLGIGDDIAYRRGAQLFRLSHARETSYFDPRVDAIRGEAQAALTNVTGSDPEATRRSAADNLLGVLAFANAARDESTRTTFLQNGAAAFQTAIKFDPFNDDSKYNLELALVRLQAEDFNGTVSPGGRKRGGFGGGAGAGGNGTGY